MEFQLESNVPNIYTEVSRDFQLFCKIFDIYLGANLSRACTVPYVLDVDKCDESLLYALANMQGFVTDKYIPPNVLRNICKVFPFCIKRKGTKEAIEVMSQAVLSTDRLVYRVSVDLVREEVDEEGDSKAVYKIYIQCNTTQIGYIPYLKEALRFITPIGWDVYFKLKFPIDYNLYTPLIVNAPIKTTILSGIPGKVMGEQPLNYDGRPSEGGSNPRFTGLNATYSTANNRMYSRISLAKIIRAKSTDDLKTQVTKLITAGEAAPLLDDNGQTTFRGENRNYPSGNTSN